MLTAMITVIASCSDVNQMSEQWHKMKEWKDLGFSHAFLGEQWPRYKQAHQTAATVLDTTYQTAVTTLCTAYQTAATVLDTTYQTAVTTLCTAYQTAATVLDTTYQAAVTTLYASLPRTAIYSYQTAVTTLCRAYQTTVTDHHYVQLIKQQWLPLYTANQTTVATTMHS